MKALAVVRTAAAVLLTVGLAAPACLAEDPKELVFIFQKQKNPSQIKGAADEVAAYLGSKLNMPVRAQVPSDYSASVQALVSKQADFAYTSSLPYLLAKRDGGAELLLVEERTDPKGAPRTDYDSVFVVRNDSPIKSVDDIVKNAGTLRLAFTSPTSTSGYLFPYRRFIKEGLLQPKQDPKSKFKAVSFGGGYTQAVQEVLSGRADVAAVSYYVVEGPTAQTYLKPEELSKVRIVGRTPGVPTHLISARAGLSDELKGRVRAALLALSAERPKLLEDVYGTAKLVPAEEQQHLRATIEAVEYLGLPIEKLGAS